MPQEPAKLVINSAEVSQYVVCPEAWRLKYLENEGYQKNAASVAGQHLREAWLERQNLSARLKKYTKLIYLLLLLLVAVVFALDFTRSMREHKTSPDKISSDNQATRLNNDHKSKNQELSFERLGQLD